MSRDPVEVEPPSSKHVRLPGSDNRFQNQKGFSTSGVACKLLDGVSARMHALHTIWDGVCAMVPTSDAILLPSCLTDGIHE